MSRATAPALSRRLPRTLAVRDRLQFLAAVAHDLQAPITRMRLRAEAMDASAERDKLARDLQQIEHLVREGMAYARSAYGVVEAPLRTDVDTLLDCLVCDYQDVGGRVSMHGRIGLPLTTRPHALRRVVGNLVDNALRHAGAAEVVARRDGRGGVRIDVLDRGPGIAPEDLDRVMLPFHRARRTRDHGPDGAGLGLAIAQQLATAIGASLTLHNRMRGGVVATLVLPLDTGAPRAASLPHPWPPPAHEGHPP